MQQEIFTFEAGGQLFGIDIMAIREIRAWTKATRLPNTPDHVAGIVNLRGTFLPVIDLAARFGWKSTEPTSRHVVIVIQVADQLRGLIVDAVHDIVTVNQDDLQASTSGEDEAIAEFVESLVSVDSECVMILKLGSLVEDSDELECAA